jgi:Uma2 family endonuclease
MPVATTPISFGKPLIIGKTDSADAPVPELEAGDRLTRPEFERRYNAMPQVNKAQLIEGVVYMPSPVKNTVHGHPHARIITLLGVYESFTPGTQCGDNASLRLDLENMPQPDAFLRYLETHNGQSSSTPDDYIQGAPELVVEISATTATVDLGPKLRAYRRNGVKEYMVWLTQERQIHYHVLVDGDYQLLSPTADGVFKSTIFPGLWIDGLALLIEDTAKQVETLMAGIKGR